MNETKGLTRRGFCTGALAAGAATAFAGLMAGCSSTGGRKADGADAADGAGYADQIAETIDADVAVIGGGISGLAATVQAAEYGASTVLVEVGGDVGGNGTGTEGMFGVNSDMQKEQGIEITLAEIVAHEIDFFNYRINATFWSDQVERSGDNLNWLVEKGVEFSGVVDDYGGVGQVPTFHWYKGLASESYIPPMKAKAEEYGAQIRTQTRARQLIVDGDGAVTGFYAEQGDGSILQVNARAVILASGGFGSNRDLVEKQGIVLDTVSLTGNPTNIGDGLEMALEAGAFDNRNHTAYLSNACLNGIPTMSAFQVAIDGSGLWVNSEGVRYTNENCGAKAMICASNTVLTQTGSYMVYDQAGIDRLAEKFESMFDLKAELEESLAQGADGLYSADTVEGLAGAMGIDKAAFAATVEQYNGYCELGEDQSFGKEPELLAAIETGPFYALKHVIMLGTTMGGILVNRDYQAVTAAREAIPGLYAVGTDSCMLYDGTYTIEVPASIGGHNLNSARTAVRHALGKS